MKGGIAKTSFSALSPQFESCRFFCYCKFLEILRFSPLVFLSSLLPYRYNLHSNICSHFGRYYKLLYPHFQHSHTLNADSYLFLSPRDIVVVD